MPELRKLRIIKNETVPAFGTETVHDDSCASEQHCRRELLQHCKGLSIDCNIHERIDVRDPVL